MLQALNALWRGEDPAQLTFELRRGLATADDLLARLRVLGLRGIRSCTLTRNRNVMVSFGGGELRVHEGYLSAPDDVLQAVVGFVQGRTRLDRRHAKRVLLGFPIVTPESPGRREKTHPDDECLAERLTAIHAQLNAERFAGSLHSLKVRVSRRMRRRLGHYCAAIGASPAEIAISRRHIRRDGWEQTIETLLHEMVHQWQDECGHTLDHGRVFRTKARELGISPFACRRVAA